MAANNDIAQDSILMKHLIILGSNPKYEVILREAKEISKKTGIPYCSRGMIFDKKRGLIWPDNFEDEMWAGGYAPRRYNTQCDAEAGRETITIEYSSAYKGFTKGLFIIVGGIQDDDKAAAKMIKKYKRVVPDAYVKKTPIYMGCMH
jgi:hypothetical protein